MAQIPEYILLSRYRLKHDALQQHDISLFDFPAHSAINDFISRLNEARHKSKLTFEEMPPYRQLNSAVLAFSPPLVHAFEATSFTGDNKESALRQMLALGKEAASLPAAKEVRYVTSHWATKWAHNSFGSFLDGPGKRLGLMERLKDTIENSNGNWHSVDTLDVWSSSKDLRRYQAIPSLLATRLHGHTMTIQNHDITWRLAQDRHTKRLIVVSNPQSYLYEYEDPRTKKTSLVNGTFAYVLQFAVHTQMGSSEPWIHAYISCRRYLDQETTKLNYGHSLTIQVGMSHPRLAGWPVTQTLVPIAVSVPGSDIEEAEWDDNLAELLEQVAARKLISPKKILKNPLEYREASPITDFDEFFPTFSEGVRPAHTIKTGIGVLERADFMREITAFYVDILIPGKPLLRDTATRSPRKVNTLAAWETLYEKNTRETVQQIIVDALQRSCNGKPVYILICWSNERTRIAILRQLRNVFALQDGEPWPNGIHIHEKYLSDDLCGLLDPGILNPEDKFNKKRPQGFLADWDQQMKRAHFERVQQWANRVWSDFPSSSSLCKFVIIESSFFSKRFPERSPKRSHREAALLGWNANSQFIRPVIARVDEDGNELEEDSMPSESRVENAVADLLFRQSGVLFGAPTSLYHIQAGLPTMIASNLTVVGIYRKLAHRTRRRQAVDYTMAVRILPSGLIEACIPDLSGKKGKWQSYYDTTVTKLGPLFARRRNLELSPEALLNFIREVILEKTEFPMLVLAEADDWRTRIWAQLKNDPEQIPNELNLNHPKITKLSPLPILIPEQRPNLRIIRLREKGTLGETPQYVSAIEHLSWESLADVKELRSAAGFVDTEAEGGFFHYLSIGKQPKTAKKQTVDAETSKQQRGGITALKYQTALEIVPIFLQEQDVALQWARVPHFLRSSPAWDGGGLLSPYPIHLAKAAFDDMMCLIGEEE